MMSLIEYNKYLFSKINNIGESEKLIKESCNAILLLALVQFLFLFLEGVTPGVIVEIVLNVMTGLLVRKYKTIFPSVIFLIVYTVALVISFASGKAFEVSQRLNTLLFVILITIGIVLVRAVYFRNNYFKIRYEIGKILIRIVFSVVLFVATGLILVLLSVFFGYEGPSAGQEFLATEYFFATLIFSLMILFGGLFPYYSSENA